MNREDLLAAVTGDGRRSKLVDVPGWPEQVLVCEFGALDAVLWRREIPKPAGTLPADPKEALKILEDLLAPGDDIKSAAKMIVLCTYKVDGSEKFFLYEDWEKVANFKREVFAALSTAVGDVNRTRKVDLEDASEDFAAARS